MELPNPFRGTIEVVCPECGPIAELLKIVIIILLVFVVGKYWTKNKLVLALVALVAAYFLFA